MTETNVPTMPCPKCGARRGVDDGVQMCRACNTPVSVLSFTPILEAAALAPGEGRCQSHPAKDAVDACERCGGYVCDVCATRTGEHLYCPACFEWLHERDELETTIPRRVRWDQMCSSLLVVSLICGAFSAPFAFVAACVTLWKRRKAPYLNVGVAIFVFSSTLLFAALIVLAMASGVD